MGCKNTLLSLLSRPLATGTLLTEIRDVHGISELKGLAVTFTLEVRELEKLSQENSFHTSFSTASIASLRSDSHCRLHVVTLLFLVRPLQQLPPHLAWPWQQLLVVDVVDVQIPLSLVS